MSKVRVHKTANFTVMSNFHFKEKKMSLKAKGLLSLMLSLPDTWNYSVSGLVTLSKDGKDSVMSALAELEKFGYLTRERVTNSKGQFAGIEYNIFEEPQQQKPISENPILENENAENPISEKPTLLNTYLIKHLNNKDIKVLNKYGEFEKIIDEIKNEELQEQLIKYIAMRENINAPLTLIGFEKLLERLARLSNNNIRIQLLLLENAIINNWKNVYLPNETELNQVNDEIRGELKALFGLE